MLFSRSTSPSRRLLFFSKAVMNYVMFARVADRIRRDPRLGLDFCAEDAVERDMVRLYAPLGVPRESHVSRLRAKWTRYDLYFSADIKLVGRRARHKAHIFHGISFKGHAYTEQIRRYDSAFLIGPYQERQFVQRGILPEGHSRLRAVGMPKTDPLVNGEFTRSAVLKELGLPDDRPVVLYAPTWRRESSLNRVGEQLLEAASRMDVHLLVKIHDLCFNPATNARDWGAWFAEKERAGAPWKFLRGRDITPYLATADLLISDASSAANEFLLRDRPIVFIDVPELLEKYRDSVDLDSWGRKTGVVVRDPKDLPRVIGHELANPGALSEIRRAAAADYFYNPGRATEAALETIYNLLELTQHA